MKLWSKLITLQVQVGMKLLVGLYSIIFFMFKHILQSKFQVSTSQFCFSIVIEHSIKPFQVVGSWTEISQAWYKQSHPRYSIEVIMELNWAAEFVSCFLRIHVELWEVLH